MFISQYSSKSAHLRFFHNIRPIGGAQCRYISLALSSAIETYVFEQDINSQK